MKRYIAEGIGTFMLVFAGTGAVAINELTGGQVTHIGIAATFGLIVMSVIYAIGDISGAHINPAVTIGFWLAKRFPSQDVFPYILSQTIGGLLASSLLYVSLPVKTTLGVTLPIYGIQPTLIFESILTMMLMFVILTVATGAKEKGIMAGIAIGGVVGLEAAFAGPLTGASMNPIRSLAPALISGTLTGSWIYLIAPIIGSIIAVYLYKLVKN